MVTGEYLVVDLPAKGLVLARYTAEVPGSQVDSIRENNPSGAYISSHLVMLQGFQPPQFLALLADMRKVYPDIDVVEQDPEGRRYLLRNKVRPDHVQAKQLLVLGKTEIEFGLYWTHIRNGTFQLRAEVTKPHAEALKDVERAKKVFAKNKVPAEVRLATLSTGERAVSLLLRELLDRYPT